ncbi:aldehyde dehydrogenase family protein [Desulfogranum japonicum]|uniref:aldehyde dehydrogenase family protein n=1 Tax=Desulfogranum japonicum TaxID=231447 RepID=UPI0004093165|nr:aldehyde dehydrogenase family protein [Desulfogranum japonicum]
MSNPIRKMYIDGSWQPAISGQCREIINPFNSQVIAEVAEGDRRDAALALTAARRAFDGGSWSTISGAGRGDLLRKLAGRIEDEKETLAEIESLDTGKTIMESRWDMEDIISIFRYYADLAEQNGDEVINSPVPQSESRVVREPVGVCGQISPWNYPLLQATWKLAPALAAGCTVVIKPSEITPLSTIRLTELAAEIDFPPGVINTVLGPGVSVGAELAESPLADLVSFTGGIETGKSIMRAASANVKKIALELGGKNPNIIFADSDLDTALEYALNGIFFHAGQICSAGTRLLLEESIHDSFVDRLATRMARIQLGNGLKEGTQMGPLISSEHRAKVERYVAGGVEEGATLVLGGHRPENAELQKGFFFLPTLFTNCRDNMMIVQEEVFGPVVTVERFKGEDEAVRLANNTIYGLAGGLWTSDPERQKRVAAKLRFGTVWINDFNVYFAQAPWGGYKQSGFGRELGRHGLEEYTEVKHVFHNHNPEPFCWFGL